MKIKWAILEKDEIYLNRIVSIFSMEYADKLEIYSFTDVDVALATLETAKIDVFVSSDSFEINTSNIPPRCGFAYLVDSPDIGTYKEQRTICKFQKAELIYKQLLSIYSENTSDFSGVKFGDDSAKIIVFSSVSGGCGASLMAASCAIHFAKQNKRTLYLNLEKFGSANSFFNADGQFDMSDIVFALKSKKANLALKLESCVKQDGSGVYFYSEPKVALDMIELNMEDVLRLISELDLSGNYDYIILDIDFSISKDSLEIYNKAHEIIWVGDGSDISNSKLTRAYNALTILEENMDNHISNKIGIIYNKFSNKIGKTVSELGIKNVGGAPKYEHATTKQVLEQLCEKDLFDNII